MISRYKIAEAWSKQKLVAGALKSAHVYRSYADYEDIFQEGILVYVWIAPNRNILLISSLLPLIEFC
jgi:transglutaminase-like putative cysteine protease